jgi:hypothetical protein
MTANKAWEKYGARCGLLIHVAPHQAPLREDLQAAACAIDVGIRAHKKGAVESAQRPSAQRGA